jgi:hypothetical protein
VHHVGEQAGAALFGRTCHPADMVMPHPTSSSTIDTDRVDVLSRELQRWLTRVRATLAAEIRSYPTPMPRSDAQFNHLVEQRDRLSRLLSEIDAALDRRDGGGASRLVLQRLPDVPPFGDSVEERSLRDRISAELSGS